MKKPFYQEEGQLENAECCKYRNIIAHWKSETWFIPY